MYFVVIWHIFLVLVYRTKKNLATLAATNGGNGNGEFETLDSLS
jgi:hypothetical protein